MLITIFISGMVGMAVQIIGLRQLTAVFQGNELTMGLLLASWLWWTALGGWIGSRVRSSGIIALGIAIILQALCVPLTIWLIRSSREILGIQPGQLVGLFPILVSALMTLLPVAVLTGLCFSLACHARRDDHIMGSGFGAIGVQQVYIAESVGAALGGLLSFFLAPLVEPFPWAILIAGIGLGAGLWTLLSFTPKGYALWGMSIIVGVVVAHFQGIPLEKSTLQPLFAGQEIVDRDESPYGQIVATRLAEQTTMYINGVKEATVPDPFAAEEGVHIAMAVQPNPQKVILIGGVTGETPREILKHPMVEQLDLVELDPDLIWMAELVFPDSVTRFLRDRKVRVWTTDGRRAMVASDQRYDVILMTLPDPLNAQVNRYYTVEWFREVRKHLSDNGVFSFGVHASENVMSREQAQFLACIYRTLQRAIPYVKVLPGSNARFLASPDSNLMHFDADSILQTLGQRGVETVYISRAYLPDILQPFRMQQLAERIEHLDVAINRDFVPVGYYTGLVLWDTHFRTSLKGIFVWLRQMPFGYVIMALGVIALLLFGVSLYKRSRGESALPLSVRTAILAVGASVIGLEILMIIAFQVVFGVVYGWVAIIVTAFMVGLAIGARLVSANRVGITHFVVVQISMVAITVLLWLRVIHSDALIAYPPLMGALLFGLMAIIVGVVGGAQFPIATALLVRSSEGERTSAQIGGGLYALDLLGSSVGAIVISAFIVPLWGLGSAFLILALLNVIPLILLR
jgi:spermidine synthase